MRARALLVGVGTVVVLGAGVWLGRETSTPTQPAGRAQPASPSEAAGPTRAAAFRASPVAAPALPAHRAAPTPGLAADLIASDPKVRRAAVREVARDGDVDPAVLLAASRDPDLEVAISATEGLARRYVAGDVPVSEILARASDRGLNPRVRTSALNALALAPTPEGAALLVELVARGDVFERATAAILLRHQDPELGIPALIGALRDADERVRANALEALRGRARGRDFGTDAAAWQAWWQARPR